MGAELSERAILAIVLRKPETAAKVFSRIPVGEFSGPYMLLAEAIHGLRTARKPVDASAVTVEMSRRGTLGRVGPAFPSEVDASYISAETLDYHLDAASDVVRQRRLFAIGTRLAAASEAEDCNPQHLATTVAEQIQGLLDGIEAEQDISTPTLREFLEGEDAPYDWVIPGLLERGDRLVLTGSEGLGKSVLFRQLAVAAAAGVHPFTHEQIPQQRVLYVDAENGVVKLRRALRALSITARQHGDGADDSLYLECRPEGLDLTRAEDEAWLVSRVAALQPSLLLTGPLYRLHAKNPNEEEPARQVARVLDRCRAAANCALVVEAHAGHLANPDGKRHVRPTGTSLWLRWPEFGYGLRPADDFTKENRLVEFVSWRGDRDERSWPARLKAGGTWPWEVATDPNAHWTPTQSLDTRSA